jgi:uroporphyrinogen-III synthase
VLYDTFPRDFDRASWSAPASPPSPAPPRSSRSADIDIPLASIGRATSAAIAQLGRSPVVQPAYPTFENLAAEIAAYLRQNPPES